MGKQRDPLSVFYDDFSARFLEVCIGDLYGWHTATVRSPARDPVDARGLTAHERAVFRSLFYVLNSTDAEGPQGGRWVKNTDHSLQIGGWSAPEYSGGLIGRLFQTGPRRRILTARCVRFSDAAAHYGEYATYTVDPAEQAPALGL